MTIARRHLSLAVSNGAPGMPDRRTESLARAYACQDMALRADNTEDRTALCGMATVWMILAQRASPKPGFLTEPKN